MKPEFKEGLRQISDTVERARITAVFAHGYQKYGGEPYLIHLHNVVLTLERFGHDHKIMLAAGYLHDTLEDTNLAPLDMVHLFGDDVYDIVYAVTNEEGANRKEKAAKTYPKIRASDRAIALKLADRISNIENCILTDNSRLGMYRKEHPAFREALYTGSHHVMWKWLDFLCRP